jgi:hypothetical protein
LTWALSIKSTRNFGSRSLAFHRGHRAAGAAADHDEVEFQFDEFHVSSAEPATLKPGEMDGKEGFRLVLCERQLRSMRSRYWNASPR